MTVAGMAIVAAFATRQAAAQAPIDSSLARYITSIRAIDSHAHPMRPVPPGAPADTDFDALPLDGIPAFDLPARLKADDPIWRLAQNALYRIAPTIGGPAYHTALKGAAEDARRTRGQKFPEWVLDQAGIDVMMANRITMGSGLSPSRFRWVAFVDPLLLPLDTRGEAARTPDTRPLYPREAKLLDRILKELNIKSLPATLDDYVKNVVNATLAKMRAGGAVAIKFEAAYLRSLDFDEPDVAAAQRVYAKYVRGGVPARAEYKTLEDYLFRAITREAGRQKLAVQIHVLETFGGFYSTRGSAPHLLEPAFNDSTLRVTKFVIVHGGWPLIGETQGLLAKPNVYADISMMDQLADSVALSNALQLLLRSAPDKVMFGTDAFDGGALQGWEQIGWVASHNARRGLTAALSSMVRENEISPDRARQLARMVLRDNAIKAYHL